MFIIPVCQKLQETLHSSYLMDMNQSNFLIFYLPPACLSGSVNHNREKMINQIRIARAHGGAHISAKERKSIMINKARTILFLISHRLWIYYLPINAGLSKNTLFLMALSFTSCGRSKSCQFSRNQ